MGCRPMQKRFAKHDAVDERQTVAPFQRTAWTTADLHESEAPTASLAGVFSQPFGRQPKRQDLVQVDRPEPFLPQSEG